MREHIRREAAQYVEAVWWLVPTVFATAALAAVVMNEPPAASLPAGAVLAAGPAALPGCDVSAAPASQVAEPVYEVEHVQAF